MNQSWALTGLDLFEHYVDVGGRKPVLGRVFDGAQLYHDGCAVFDCRFSQGFAGPFGHGDPLLASDSLDYRVCLLVEEDLELYGHESSLDDE